MRNLIYLDSFSFSSFHDDFNASSLKMFSLIFEHVDYYATKSARNAVEGLLGTLPDNVSFHPLAEIRDGGSVRNALRHLHSSFIDFLFVLFSRKDTVVYINYNSLWGLRSIARISEFRQIDVIQQCHGELEHLLSALKLNFLSERSLMRIKNGYFRNSTHLYFCVAGSSILQQLKSILDKKTLQRFISFEHTCVRRAENKILKECSPDSRISLAVVGSPSVSKGIYDFISLKDALSSAKYRFFCLGKIGKFKNVFDRNGIEYIPGTESSFASKELMQEYIAMMDAILFLYPPDSYKLTASGALIDAIASGKPVLSYRNSYFDPFFEKYDIGCEFDNLDDLVSFLKPIDKEGLRELRSAPADFLSPDTEAESFLKILIAKNLM